VFYDPCQEQAIVLSEDKLRVFPGLAGHAVLAELAVLVELTEQAVIAELAEQAVPVDLRREGIASTY